MAKKKKKIIKCPKLYTKEERQAKISAILMQIVTMELSNIINDDIRQLLQKWIDTGETVEKDIPLKQYGRTMLIRLYNDKKITTYINLKHNTINVKDDDGRLNEMQKMTEEGKIEGMHEKELDKIERKDKEKLDELDKMEKILENGSLEELEALEKELGNYI